MDLKVLMLVLIGIVLFLFGIENFSLEVQRSSGEKFRKFLKKATRNRLLGAFSGFLTTALINSSTATTLIAVGLVNAGLISFVQSLPVIFGANIGSTITAQLVAFKLTYFAPFLLVIGFVLSFFKKTKLIGKPLFYFGLLFFGLNLVSEAIVPYSKNPEVLNLFSSFDNLFLGILISFIFTVIFNSSALTMGLAIVLASKGLISLNQSIPIILGANLGTTITTLIASFKMNLHAKRSAIAHLIFNVLGVFLFLPFLSQYVGFISFIGGSVERQIANAHTFFNLVTASIFLILLNPFKRVVEALVRGNEEEILLESKYLKEKLPEEKNILFSLIEKEIINLIEVNKKMFILSKEVIMKNNEKDISRLKKLALLSDILTEEIVRALFYLSQKKLSEVEARKVLLLIRITNSFEQLGDLAEDLVDLPESHPEVSFAYGREISGSVDSLFDRCVIILSRLSKDFLNFKTRKSEKSFLKTGNINELFNKEYSKNMPILKKENVPEASLFVEVCSILENVFFKLEDIYELVEEYSKVRIQ